MVGCNSGRATPFLRRHRPSAIPNHQPRRNATYHSREAVQTTEASSVPAPKRDRDTRPETFRPVLRRSENDAAAHRSSTSSLRFSLGDILDIKRPNSTRVRYSQTKIAPDTRAPDHPVGRGYARPDPSGIGSSGLDRADDLAEGGFRKRL